MTNTAKEYYSLVEIKMRWPCGYVTEKLGRALIAVGPQIVRFTKPEHPTRFRGVECGPGTVAKAVTKAQPAETDQDESDGADQE